MATSLLNLFNFSIELPERMYIVHHSDTNQETFIKACSAYEAVRMVFHLEYYELDSPYIDDYGWYVFETIKGTVSAKLYEREICTSFTFKVYLGNLTVYTKVYRTKASTSNGLKRSESLFKNKLKHELGLIGIDFTSIITTKNCVIVRG
jgi:hypothetical protein